MNTTSFKFSAISRSDELLEKVCVVSKIGKKAIQDSDKVILFLISTTDFDTDSLINQINATIQNIIIRLSKQEIGQISFTLDVEIIVTDGDDESIPGIVFPASFISNASKLSIWVKFHLYINSSTKEGLMNSGAYIYIESDNEIDIQALDKVAGTTPSFVYRKGGKGMFTVAKYDAWKVESKSDKQTPDIPAKELMNRLKNAKEIGSYCMNNNITPVAYLSCYGIPSKPLYFQLEPKFFTFLKELSALFVDIDLMC